jgi:hypothetical protein
MARFELGRMVATPGALAALTEAGQSPSTFLSRHLSEDWGDVDIEDWAANDQATLNGTRIFSAYTLSTNVKIWVITEADRSSTCILLPEEY